MAAAAATRHFSSIACSSSMTSQTRSPSFRHSQFSARYTWIDAAPLKMTSRNVRFLSIQAVGSGSYGSEFEYDVKKTVGANPVVVYSKSWCSYSMEVKSLFKCLGVEPLVVELDQLGQQGLELQNSLKLLTGQRTVPNVFIGGKHIGGCSDTVDLHKNGKLEALLSEARAKKLER